MKYLTIMTLVAAILSLCSCETCITQDEAWSRYQWAKCELYIECEDAGDLTVDDCYYGSPESNVLLDDECKESLLEQSNACLDYIAETRCSSSVDYTYIFNLCYPS